MHLPEGVRVEPLHQLGQRRADQVLAVARMHHHIFVVGLEVQHVLDRHVAGGVAPARPHPAQRRRAGLRAGRAARELAQQLRQLRQGRRLLEGLAQPLHGPRQALVRDRLDEIVHGLALEGVQRVLVEGGDEDHPRVGLDALRHLQPGQPRHLDIEKGHRRRQLCDGLRGLHAIGRLPHDAQLGPQPLQLAAQVRAQVFLVIGDQRGGRPGHGVSPFRKGADSGMSMWTAVPGERSTMRTCASPS
ncbi:hypothetical protein D3C87_1274820 [compost metagenome]